MCMCSVVSDFLWPHGLQHVRLPCPSLTHRACSNSFPSSLWSHSTVSSSVVPFSSCLQPFQASGSFPMSQFFTLGGQSIGVSVSASGNDYYGAKIIVLLGNFLSGGYRAETSPCLFYLLEVALIPWPLAFFQQLYYSNNLCFCYHIFSNSLVHYFLIRTLWLYWA